MTKIYICDRCGKSYHNSIRASMCEASHRNEDNYKLVKTIKNCGYDPCTYCGRSYAVHNSKVNCPCSDVCQSHNLFITGEMTNGASEYNRINH